MGYIFLRLPSYVVWFNRGQDYEHPLQEWEPVRFAESRHEWNVLQNNLRLIPEENQSSLCFSQRAWNNICKGRSPDGRKQILNRDQKDWPSVSEICTLTSKEMTLKQQSMDYLCIEIPREVILCGRVYQSNPSYALSYGVASDLSKMLRQEFKHVFLDFAIQDRRSCNKNHVHRDRLEMLERFMTKFHMPVSVDRKERESLRRQTNRWLKDAHLLPNDRLDFEDSFVEHISQDERDREERIMKRYAQNKS